MVAPLVVGRSLKWTPRSHPLMYRHFIISSHLIVGRSRECERYHSHGYITLQSKGDFADVIKVPNQLTLSSFKWEVYQRGLI